MRKICICGGGNLGHVTAGFLAAHGDCEVMLLTRRPALWQQELTIQTPEGKSLKGQLSTVSDSPAMVIPQADIVLLCLPGFSIREELERIRPYLGATTAVGSVVSSTGFFFEAFDVLPPTTPLFGFQRVPFISRITDYGRAASLLGYKPSLNVSIERLDDPEPLRALLERLLKVPVHLLGNHYEASLTNSNPILHPSRLYSQWKDWHEGIVYPKQSLFYEQWTDEASELLITMDEEFQQLLNVLPVTKGSIPTITDYYESTDAASLTRKLRSIEAFKGILSPMKAVEGGGFVPDFNNRYFTEDFPYGLRIIHDQARLHQVETPVIDRVLSWGLKKIGK